MSTSWRWHQPPASHQRTEGMMGFKETWKAQQRRADAAKYISEHGRPSPQLVCPHCQVQGRVSTKQVKQKVGVSGGKATAAVLTGGISLLGTGLSRKQQVTQAHCGNCGSTWAY